MQIYIRWLLWKSHLTPQKGCDSQVEQYSNSQNYKFLNHDSALYILLARSLAHSVTLLFSPLISKMKGEAELKDILQNSIKGYI